jgi:NADH dehydrogenase
MSRPARVLLAGGTGFIGRALAARLAREGVALRIPTRRPDRHGALRVLPGVELVDAAIGDPAALPALLAGCDAAVNLVGILHDRRGAPYGPAFAAAHVDWPRRLGEGCAAAGIARLVHVSALGVDLQAPMPSMYLRSKADGERALAAVAGLAPVILRPSVVFGPQDGFLNLFAALQRRLPVMLLAGADARLQPVYVGDVAAAIAAVLAAPIGSTPACVALAGPDVFTLRELVALAGRLSGHPRPIVALPAALGRLQAAILEHLPGGPLMSRDNLDSLGIDNVARDPQPMAVLGVRASRLADVAPAYLRPPEDPLDAARRRAHR